MYLHSMLDCLNNFVSTSILINTKQLYWTNSLKDTAVPKQVKGHHCCENRVSVKFLFFVFLFKVLASYGIIFRTIFFSSHSLHFLSWHLFIFLLQHFPQKHDSVIQTISNDLLHIKDHQCANNRSQHNGITGWEHI